MLVFDDNKVVSANSVGYAFKLDKEEKVLLERVVYISKKDKFGFCDLVPKDLKAAYVGREASEQMISNLKKLDIYSIDEWNEAIAEYNKSRDSMESLKQKILSRNL